MPMMWTFFVFIFGLNLAGMVPWLGSPTASLATTGCLRSRSSWLGYISEQKSLARLATLKTFVLSLACLGICRSGLSRSCGLLSSRRSLSSTQF